MKVVSIGRSTDNTVVISDSMVSRHHAQLTVDNMGNVRITDLNSVNGTYVNGKKITSDTPLRPGDTVRIANANFPWEAHGPSHPVAPPTVGSPYVPGGGGGGKKNPWLLPVIIGAAVILIACGVYYFVHKPEPKPIQIIEAPTTTTTTTTTTPTTPTTTTPTTTTTTPRTTVTPDLPVVTGDLKKVNIFKEWSISVPVVMYHKEHDASSEEWSNEKGDYYVYCARVSTDYIDDKLATYAEDMIANIKDYGIVLEPSVTKIAGFNACYYYSKGGRYAFIEVDDYYLRIFVKYPNKDQAAAEQAKKIITSFRKQK